MGKTVVVMAVHIEGKEDHSGGEWTASNTTWE